ncbi:hypothetical protein MGH68_07110 [Erysipelothrix sp. D19-032]
MMNKYQEALDRLKLQENWQEGNELQILQELVDRETPIRPVENVDFLGNIYCRQCNEVLDVDWVSCPCCQHKIDWSKNEA